MKSALTFETTAACSTTKARVSVLTLPHGPVNTPVFMPVGTQGTMKGVLPEQLEELNCQIMLNNTYHLVCIFIQMNDLFLNNCIGFKTWKRNIGPCWWSTHIPKLET